MKVKEAGKANAGNVPYSLTYLLGSFKFVMNETGEKQRKRAKGDESTKGGKKPKIDILDEDLKLSDVSDDETNAAIF